MVNVPIERIKPGASYMVFFLFMLDVVFFIRFTTLAEPANVAKLTNVQICCQIHVICLRMFFVCVNRARLPTRTIGYYSHEPNLSYISLKRNQAVDWGWDCWHWIGEYALDRLAWWDVMDFLFACMFSNRTNTHSHTRWGVKFHTNTHSSCAQHSATRVRMPADLHVATTAHPCAHTWATQWCEYSHFIRGGDGVVRISREWSSNNTSDTPVCTSALLTGDKYCRQAAAATAAAARV